MQFSLQCWRLRTRVVPHMYTWLGGDMPPIRLTARRGALCIPIQKPNCMSGPWLLQMGRVGLIHVHVHVEGMVAIQNKSFTSAKLHRIVC